MKSFKSLFSGRRKNSGDCPPLTSEEEKSFGENPITKNQKTHIKLLSGMYPEFTFPDIEDKGDKDTVTKLEQIISIFKEIMQKSDCLQWEKRLYDQLAARYFYLKDHHIKPTYNPVETLILPNDIESPTTSQESPKNSPVQERKKHESKADYRKHILKRNTGKASQANFLEHSEEQSLTRS